MSQNSKISTGIRSNTSEGSCEVSVFAAIDVSGSMGGPKCLEVCASLQDLINQCPDNVLFNITLFSTTAWNAVTALKTGVKVSKLKEDIQTAVSRKGMTALYDAWGDMLTSIPESVLKFSILRIFVLTDGEDNASSRYTKDSVMNLSASIMKGRNNVEFHFIQVGKQGNASLLKDFGTLSSTLNGNQIQSLVVDDSDKGIRAAMSSVNKNILLSTRSKNNPGSSNKLPANIDEATQESNKNMYPFLSTIRQAPSAPVPNSTGMSGIGFNKDLLSTSRPKRLGTGNIPVKDDDADNNQQAKLLTSTTRNLDFNNLNSSKSFVLK